MSILTALFNSEVRELIKDSAISSTERAVAKNIMNAVGDSINNSSITQYSNMMALGLLFLSLGENNEENAVPQTLARTIVRGTFAELVDYAKSALKPYELEKLMAEGGALVGVTSSEDILRVVADYYAEIQARESAYYRFNTQGKATTAVTITLPQFKKDKQPDDIKVEILRQDMVQFPSQAVQPYAWRKLHMNPWPLARYADAELLNKESVLGGQYKYFAPTGDNKTFTREDLHLRITAKLDEAINPTFMVSNKEDYATMTAVPMESVYSRGIYAGNYQFNAQAAKGAEVTMNTVPASETKTEVKVEVTEPKTEVTSEVKPETKTEVKEELSFPIVKEKCKLANGNYKCFRCGKEGLKKGNLQTFLMKKLPEGVDAKDFEEEVKWSGSNVCGDCRDALKNMQEAKLSKMNEYTKAVAEWEKAEAEVEKQNNDIKKMEDNIEKLKGVGGDVAILEQTLETMRFNVQKAEAYSVELAAKVDSLDPSKSKQEEPKEEVKEEVKEPVAPVQESASTNAKNGVLNARTLRKNGKKARKAAANQR